MLANLNYVKELGYRSKDLLEKERVSDFGALMHEHIAVAPNGVYFFSHPQGLYFYNGTQVIDIFANLKSMYPDGYINSTADDKISVSYVNDRVWLSMPFSKTTSVLSPALTKLIAFKSDLLIMSPVLSGLFVLKNFRVSRSVIKSV
jgi:hypothetical protein